MIKRPVLLIALALPAAALANPSFTPLGDLAGGGFSSYAGGISRDGSVVVGQGLSASGLEASRWTSAGMVGIGDLPGGLFESAANGVSADGNVVVGEGRTASERRAFRWTSAGMVDLGDLPGGGSESRAFAVSADGTVVVGQSSSSASGSGAEAFRWTASGMVGLGDLTGGTFFSQALAVSGDGNVVVGLSDSALGVQAFRHTSSTGMVGIGDLAGGAYNSAARGASADGAVIVGSSSSAASGSGSGGLEAFRWTAAGMVGLGDLPGGAFSSLANAVSPDGLVVVGRSSTNLGTRAFIWDGVNGMKDLREVLVAGGLGAELTGWTLTEATAVTVTLEGTPIIAGYGTDPQGRQQAFVAAVPEPATLAALGLGALALLRRRRRTA